MSALRKTMSEEQAVHLVRNALLVAGTEMGEDGDHWPVINSTIHSIAKDYEDLKVQRNVDKELKIHLYGQLSEMEVGLKDCNDNVRNDVAVKLKELREVYDAYFTELDTAAVAVYENDMPVYLKRAEVIVSTLENENESF